MLTLSNLAALLVSFSIGVSAVPVVHPAPALGTLFAVYPGWDMDNGQAIETSDGSELACMKLCSAGGCVAYSYGPYQPSGTPSCFLKDSVDLSTFKIRNVDVSVGLVGTCGTSVTLVFIVAKLGLICRLPTVVSCQLVPPPASASLFQRKWSRRIMIEGLGNLSYPIVAVLYPQQNTLFYKKASRTNGSQ
ncbi:hypothetical protein DFH08DRAFT_973411 [Mycena albidolilacea]|uniref:Apple domain-containing protein n=1 Tax=Mycena albidolilacea TaxID=1033008 RepID=A0AAD6ZA77_9AGAR|nr:hypothetical protein DFH08DRAFT_973411 [Mycena albidolilacea]